MRARVPLHLTNKQKIAMDQEIQKQIAEYDKNNWQEIDAMVLWVLRQQTGWGAKRLRRFHDEFANELRALINRYEMNTEDTAWLCTRKLKDAGIDISEWSKED